MHAVDEALGAGERIHHLVTTRARATDPRIRELVARARSRGIETRFEGDGWFARLGAGHQHVAAVVDAFTYTPWETIRELARSRHDVMMVALDHIEDPRNVGAIVRAAEGAGVSAIVLPERRSAGVTPVARRAAAGAASHLAIAQVTNLVRTLADLKEAGCWITGLAQSPSAKPYAQADLTGKRVFVVGSEGRGLQRLVAEQCDELVVIPMLGSVGSLNAASAAAVVLFEAVRQRSQKPHVPQPNKWESRVNP